MSDDFDKEAERKKLREKYESEAEDRAATEHMSELLLKGATMTNKHCGNCGDPIFRHDGQEFCPTCSQDAETTAGDAAASTGTGGTDDASRTAAADQHDQSTTGSTAASASPSTSPSAEAEPGRPQDTGGDANATPNPERAQPTGAGTDTGATPRPADHGTDPRHADPGAESPHADHGTGRGPGAHGTDRGPVAVDGDAVAQVRATIDRFAAAAAQTDDPTRARECLEVVRTAAETLRVLRTE